MAGEDMDIEVAEKQLKSLEHSEQHYFNRQVWRFLGERFCRTGRANFCPLAITIMVRRIPLRIRKCSALTDATPR